MRGTDNWETFDNELRRGLIQNHPNFAEWRGSFTRYACNMLDAILEDELTPESILFAQNAPEEEGDEYQFISIISGGDPHPDNMSTLTNIALRDLLYEVRGFKKAKK